MKGCQEWHRVSAMGKVTDNMKVIYGALQVMGGKGFAREVLNHLIANGVQNKTFNGVNATLAALAGKGYVTKDKGLFNEKVYTIYTIAKELVVAEEVATEEVAAEVIEDEAGEVADAE